MRYNVDFKSRLSIAVDAANEAEAVKAAKAMLKPHDGWISADDLDRAVAGVPLVLVDSRADLGAERP